MAVASGTGGPEEGAGRETPSDPDDLWRAIVANYGDRARLDDDAGAGPEAEAGPEPPTSQPGPDLSSLKRLFDPLDRPPARDDVGPAGPAPDSDLSKQPDAPFVPPPPPPVPATTPDRRAAWVGVVGAPALLLVSLLVGVTLPQIVLVALVGGFVGGFGYLVFRMEREPRDPGDDGARL